MNTKHNSQDKWKDLRERIRTAGRNHVMESDGSYSYTEDLSEEQINKIITIFSSLLSSREKEIEGLRLYENGSGDVDFQEGYNQAIDDVLKIIKK